MFGTMKLLSMIAGVGLLAGVATMSVHAEDAPVAKEKGTVSGMVIDANGKAVASANVAIVDASQMPGRPKKDKKAADGAEGKPKGDKPKGDRPEPVAKGKTDAEGKFSLTDVPAGEYMLVARAKEAGNARQKITVTAGQDTHVELTLQVRGAKKPQ